MRTLSLALLGVLVLGVGAGSARAEDAPRVGGFLPLDDACRERWCWSGAWAYPVGDRFDYTRADGDSGRGFTLLRGVQRDGRGHTGADLGDGRAGDAVRAASDGVVIRVEDDGEAGGYGCHVVLAHRLAEGGLAYTVYAHLARGGSRVHEGDVVALGQVLGRVGRTGRASTDHLHFEVRRPRDLAERWEKAAVVDPLAFVAARLPAEPSGAGAAVALWAAGADLVDRDADLATPLARAAWWHVLWRSARHAGDVLPDGPASLGEALIQASVLPEDAAHARGVVTWSELARDLERLRTLGLRLPPAPAAAEDLRAWCRQALGAERPSRRPAALDRLAGAGPTLEQALLVLADLADGGAGR